MALQAGFTKVLEENGYKKGETAYLEQIKLPLGGNNGSRS
jgi:hypothetical protein